MLNDRERRIFEARRLADDPITLEDLAAEFGVSRERVRQIEVRAFEKVQKAVKNQRRRHGAADGNAGDFQHGALSLRRDRQEFKWPGTYPGHFRYPSPLRWKGRDSYSPQARNASSKARTPGVPFSIARMARLPLV